MWHSSWTRHSLIPVFDIIWNAFEFGSCEHDFGWKTLDFSTRVTNSHSNHFSYTFAVMFITIACDLSFTSDRLESKKKCFVWQEHVKWLNVRCSVLFVKGLVENVKSQWAWTCGTQQVFIHINHRTFFLSISWMFIAHAIHL